MAKSRDVHPHSRSHRLVRLDGRTQVAKLVDEYRARLSEHVGGSPTITQAALIERAAFVHLRCALLDAKIVEGTFSEQDSRCYLAAVNTERRILAQLGLEAPSTASLPKSIADIRAEIIARRPHQPEVAA